jgi:hypothetical protein
MVEARSTWGMTEGEFSVSIAYKGEFEGFPWCEGLVGAPAVLRHILNCTGSGRKIGIPAGKPRGWTVDDRLEWTERFGRTDTPTFFYKEHWVSRKLELKELRAVLDVPIVTECGTDLRRRLKCMKVPGNIYVAVLDEIQKAFRGRKGKRKRAEKGFGRQNKTSGLEDKLLKESPARTETLAIEDSQATSGRQQTITDKAAKSDNAAVPTWLCNDEISRTIERLDPEDPKVTAAFDTLRDKWLLSYWKRQVVRDLTTWLRVNDERLMSEERRKSVEAGRKALRYSGGGGASWWKWDGGSFPFFWRWHEEYQFEVRDGLTPRFRDVPPACFENQRINRDPLVLKMEHKKIDKVITFGYLMKTCWEGVTSLMHFFSAMKGDLDIRMVYNGTKSGLNAATWIPWFAIPSSAALERIVTKESVQVDNDYEDMFLNFKLHDDLRKFTGVDVSGFYQGEKNEEDRIELVTWDIPAMGLTGSPYTCYQGAVRGKRVTLGDRNEKSNPFHWQSVVLNVPGAWDYDPTKPRVYNIRWDRRMASD